MVKFSYILVGCCLIIFSLQVRAEELSANPWVKANANQGAQERQDVFAQSYERPVDVYIPNTVQYVSRVQRGGYGSISRARPKAKEPSFFDGLFDSKTTTEASANNAGSGDMFTSWFGNNSSPQSTSNSGFVDGVEDQYKSIADGYNSTKNTVMQTIDGAKKSIGDLTTEAQKLLP